MTFLDSTPIEIINPHIPRGRIRHALFDFDGTVSLIREGWQGVMIPMMVEVLLETPRHESKEELYAVVTEFVDRLTGKQTIYQMIQLREEVRQRGGEPLDPLDYKRMYLDRLWERIKGRVARLKNGEIEPEEMMVIERILNENHLSGPELVTFGDGYVEIEDTKAVGGIAVGVASDEVNRRGINEWKRARLIQAGADLIVPDFRQHERLVAYLFAED